MDDSQPGPSRPKRQKLVIKNKNALTEQEMLHFLVNSDSEEEFLESEDEYLPDLSGSSDSESDTGHDDPPVVTCDSDDEQVRTNTLSPTPSLGNNTRAPNVNLWQDDPDLRQFDFTKRSQLLVPRPQGNEPIDYFFLIADEGFFELVVTQTNKYAEEVFLAGVDEHSRITRWKPLSATELQTFIGLVLHMGTLKTNRLQDYWKTDPLFNLKCFRDSMSRDRFLLILRCLHFAENLTGEAALRDRIYKIRPLIDYFNNKMHEIYQPGKNLSLDESMILWRGRLVFKQFIKNKRHKYGIKLYVLTEYDGMVLNLNVYTGALDSMGGKGHSKKVVLHLMKNCFQVGHSLFIDNFYTAVDLAEELLEKKTHCTGTLNVKRREIPREVKEANLKKGETIGKYRNNVLVGKWRDKRDVLYLSTEFENTMQEVNNKRGQQIVKPLPILEYNKYMSGVDRKDQMLSYYPCERKTLRWYKKLAIHIFQVALLNSYYLFIRFSGQKMSLYDFRLQVIRKLLDVSNIPKPSKSNDSHFPTKISSKNKKGETQRKKCRVCTKNKIRRDSIYECATCPERPGLCLGECFTLFHQ